MLRLVVGFWHASISRNLNSRLSIFHVNYRISISMKSAITTENSNYRFEILYDTIRLLADRMVNAVVMVRYL